MTEQEYLHMIVAGLVEDEEGISIEKKTDDQGILLTLRVAKEDMGRVIGKHGYTVNALRQIMKCFGYKSLGKEDINLKIEEPLA